MPIRIIIADDHGVLRAGLRALLSAESDMEVVGEASDAEGAVELAARLQPDLLLMDISLPGIDGIEATRRVMQMLCKTRVLLLTVHEDYSLLREGLRAGASGYIVKRAAESELINAIHAVHNGDLYVHPAMTRGLLEKGTAAQPRRTTSPSPTLTQREIEVLQRIAMGYTNRQVATELNISIRTVESHRAHIMEKLDLHSRVELVRFATQQGLIGTEEA